MKRNLIQRFNQLNKNPRLINSLVMFCAMILIFILLSKSIFDGYYDYQIGDTAKEDIYLKMDVLDQIETDRLVTLAIENTEPVTYIDFSKLVEAKKTLTDFFQTLTDIKTMYAEDKEMLQKVYAGIEKDNAFSLDEDELFMLSTLSGSRTEILRNYAIDITSENMSAGVSANNKSEMDDNIDAFIDDLVDLRDIERTVLKKLVHGAMVVNQFINIEKTTEKQNDAAAKVDEVTYRKGSLIVYKDDILTDKQIQLLKDGEMLYTSIDYAWTMVLGIGILLVLLWFTLHFFLYEFKKDVLYSKEKYGLLMSAFLLTILTSPIFNNISPYFIPVPIFGILTSIMLSATIAVPFGIVLIMILSFWHGLSIHITMMYLLGLLFCTLMSKNIRQRSQLLMNGIYTGLAMTLYILSSYLIFRLDLETLPLILVYVMGNGILSAILSIGIMPIFETIFNILTPFKLLELSNPNKDILKQLMLEAPGTYHHSILVGNLAETAAHDIGADSVFARVAAFYHDIGKLERPYYFKENQFAGENPHDMLPPQVSANILKQHVEYGVTLAQKHKLPREIIDIIKTHHGTTAIKYFFHLEQQKNENVDVKPFLYEGPRPTKKEAVIIMLADSVEAAVRTLEHPNKENVTALVDKIVKQKIDEGQLDQAHISLKEIDIVKLSFIKVLSGIFHERVVYPDIEIPQVKREEN